MTAAQMVAGIESARQAAHLSQRALQDRTGISQSTLSRILSGGRPAKMTEIIQTLGRQSVRGPRPDRVPYLGKFESSLFSGDLRRLQLMVNGGIPG